MAEVELIPSERGKIWIVWNVMNVPTRYGTICIYPGFLSDLDSVVPNLPDVVPPIVHDFGYRHRITQRGKILTRRQWDRIYADLSLRSDSWLRKLSAIWRYPGLRIGVPIKDGCGWIASRLRGGDYKKSWGDPLPIPIKHTSLYLHTPYN